MAGLSNAHPQHGGNLHQAVTTYGIPRSDWLDLSTGISPWPWPVPQLPEDVWQRLPEADGQLEQAASSYYGAPALPIPGSQWAIQQLPTLVTPRRVWMAQESYEEYRFWWQQQGHQLVTFGDLPTADQLQTHDVVIVINPNNPTGLQHSAQALLALAQALESLQGWLIVDEAFMDATPDQSLLPLLSPDQPVTVLRSLGKFFGLAGIRTGFVLGNADIRATLQARLGPWAVSHPAQHIATLALTDHQWHTDQRRRLDSGSQLLLQQVHMYFPVEAITASRLFVSLHLPDGQAARWHDALARQGIWTRLFPHWERLRIGLADAAGLERLAAALNGAKDTT